MVGCTVVGGAGGDKIGHLLQDGQGISDTSRPEGIPYLVDAIIDFAGYHMESVLLNGFV